MIVKERIQKMADTNKNVMMKKYDDFQKPCDLYGVLRRNERLKINVRPCAKNVFCLALPLYLSHYNVMT